MEDWKQRFDKNTLERGKASFLNKRVDDLKEINGGYTAAVLGRERFPVTVRMPGGSLGHMSCSCPVSRMGRNCEHMAAVLYAIEARGEAAKEALTEAELLTKWKQMDEALRQKEGKKAEKKSRQKVSKTAEEKSRQEKAKAAEEAPHQEEAKAAEEARRLEQERQEKRLAREKRKAEMARKKEEQKRLAEEARRKENEKRLAEEARRES